MAVAGRSRLPGTLLLAVLTLGALAGAHVLLHTIARAMIYPGSPLAFPDRAAIARLAPGARLLDYAAADGTALRAAYLPPASPKEPVVVYFHGNAESAALNLPLAFDLRRAGPGVLLAEYRGYGGLSGRPTEAGLFADADAAVAAARAAGALPELLVLAGRSLGTGVALEAALRHRPALVLLVSPYTSMVEMGRLLVGPFASLVVPDRFDSLERVKRVTAPVVVVHGTRDDVVPFAMGRAIAAAGPTARLVEVPGATHNDIPDLSGLLLREIARVLPPAPSPTPDRS